MPSRDVLIALHGQPIELDGENVDQQIADDEHRHREAQHRKAHHDAVEPAALPIGGEHAERNGDQRNGDDDREERQRQRRLEPVEDQLGHGLCLLEEIRRGGGAVRDRAAEKDKEQRLPAHEDAEAGQRPALARRVAARLDGVELSHEHSFACAATGATRTAISRSKAIAATSSAPRERLAPERRHVHDDERAVDRVQEQRAERGAEDRAAAAEDRDAADDDRGDHLELVADAGDRVDRARSTTARQHPASPAIAAAQDEREEDPRARPGCRRGAPRPGPSRSRRSRAPCGSVRIA